MKACVDCHGPVANRSRAVQRCRPCHLIAWSPWNKGIATGHTPWNKGKKGVQIAWNKGVPMGDAQKEKLRVAHIGMTHTAEHRAKIGAANRGRSLSAEHCVKISVSRRQIMTPEFRREMSENRRRSNAARGIVPVAPEEMALRRGIEYKLWREAVFARDDWTCRTCLQRGYALHAHHIMPFASHPDLRFDVANGETLCVACHRVTFAHSRRTIDSMKHRSTSLRTA